MWNRTGYLCLLIGKRMWAESEEIINASGLSYVDFPDNSTSKSSQRLQSSNLIAPAPLPRCQPHRTWILRLQRQSIRELSICDRRLRLVNPIRTIRLRSGLVYAHQIVLAWGNSWPK